MILIVDNYDSFVHNVARYFEELGRRTKVVRNDQVSDEDLEADAIVLSPGPCTPHEAGQSLDILKSCSGKLPILGICLGHQCIGEAFGGKVLRAHEPMHGMASQIAHYGTGIFAGIPNRFAAGRYHSLIVEIDKPEATPLDVTARSEEGEIMGLKHREHPTFGVQFHPESIMTEHGYDILRNFLRYVP